MNRRRSGQESIRLVIVLLYFIFLLPGLLIPVRFWDKASGFPVYLLTTVVLGMMFLMVELTEYIRWGYSYDDRRIPRQLFVIRSILLLFPIVLMAASGNWNLERRIVPQAMMLASLLPFYAYYSFRKSVSVVMLVIFTVLPFVFDILINREIHSDANSLGFATYRTLTIVFFYLLAWLLDMERRRDEENRRLVIELKESESRTRMYADRIAHTVALEERTRLARDIHDSLGHALTAIKIQLSKAEAYQEVDRSESAAAVKAARETAEDAMNDVRESLGRLNGDEAGISLAQALPRLAQRLRDSGLEVEYTLTGTEDGYNYSVLTGFYRFAQEGVTNILKHSGADKVFLTIELGVEEARMTIADNGAGFEPAMVTDSDDVEHGYGLRGLHRRFELVRGLLDVQSTPGNGTILTATAPKDPIRLLKEPR